MKRAAYACVGAGLWLLASGGAAADDLGSRLGLEGARQELVAGQLAELVARFDALARDLNSNPGIGVEAARSVGVLRDRLETVRQLRVNRARSLLAESARDLRPADPRILEAHRAIVLAARELGSLLLQAGVSQACEVFAVELREIIGRQRTLPGGDAAATQADLAGRTAGLLDELRAPLVRPGDPLAAVRLARARKIAETADVVGEMRRAASADAAGAASCRERAIKALQDALQKLRPDARLEELVRARNELKALVDGQQALAAFVAGLPPERLAAQAPGLALRQEAVGLALGRFDEGLEIGAQLRDGQAASDEAARSLNAGRGPDALAAQAQVGRFADEARRRLDEQIAKLDTLGEAHRRMLASAERAKGVADLRDRLESVRNHAYRAAAAGPGLDTVAQSLRQASRDVGAFSGRLPAGPRSAAALRRPLARAGRLIADAADALSGGLAAALPAWDLAEGLLKESADIARRELEGLERLWLFRQASADIKAVGRVLEDVSAEQADLRAAVEAARAGNRTALDFTEAQDTLARAAAQIEEDAAGIQEAGAMGPALAAALEAMRAASAFLGKDEGAPAVEAMGRARAGLDRALQVARGVVALIDVLAAEAELSAELSGRAMDLYQRQVALRVDTEEAPADAFGRLAGEQDVLLAETEILAGITVAQKASEAFGKAVGEMRPAIAQLRAPARDPAVAHQKKAEEYLLAGIRALDEYIRSMMALLAGEGALRVLDYQAMFDAMTALLVLATEQRELRELTVRTPEASLAGHVPRQTEFRQRADEIARMPNPLTGVGAVTGVEHVQAAVAAMDRAAAALTRLSKDPAIEHMQAAEKELRIAFAMNLADFINALRPPLPPTGGLPGVMDARIMDRYTLFGFQGWKEFSKASPQGAPPRGSRGEWNSLTDREREALNENFARELPLEFRALLKDYYEALAR